MGLLNKIKSLFTRTENDSIYEENVSSNSDITNTNINVTDHEEKIDNAVPGDIIKESALEGPKDLEPKASVLYKSSIEIKQKNGNVIIRNINETDKSIYDFRNKFFAFDVKTTGLNIKTDRIVKVDAVLFEYGRPVNHYQSLIKYNIPRDQEAIEKDDITDDMLKTAPEEKKVFDELVEFLGDSLNEKTVLVAHYASFHVGILKETLIRLGFDARIIYIDTVLLSRRILPVLNNYERDTLRNYFKISNMNKSDAEISGMIFQNLLDYKDVERLKKDNKNFTEDELEICSHIKTLLARNECNMSFLRFNKISNNSIVCKCLYKVVTFKVTEKGRYILIPIDIAEKSKMIVERCSPDEDGRYRRVYFISPYDIDIFEKYLVERFKSRMDFISEEYNFSQHPEEIRRVKRWISNDFDLTYNERIHFEFQISKKDYSYVTIPTIKEPIKREKVKITKVPERKKLVRYEILEYYDEIPPKINKEWMRGEELRKNGDFTEAIQCFEKCRRNGCLFYLLYLSFAKTYHKQKDFENEILILDEGIDYLGKDNSRDLRTIRERAIESLYNVQEKARIAKEKRDKIIKREHAKEKETKHTKSPYKPIGRAVYQMDDNLTILAEYESVSSAAAAVGIDTKGIRSAAKGVQKHAGGYVWRYKDEYDNN